MQRTGAVLSHYKNEFQFGLRRKNRGEGKQGRTRCKQHDCVVDQDCMGARAAGSENIGQNFHCCRNVYTESVPAHENPCLYLYHAARVLSCANECAGIDHAAPAGSIRNPFHPVCRCEHAVERGHDIQPEFNRRRIQRHPYIQRKSSGRTTVCD